MENLGDRREELVLGTPRGVKERCGRRLGAEVLDVRVELAEVPRFGPETDGPEVALVASAEVGLQRVPAGTGEELEEADYSGTAIP